jgi:hypothetical protein
LSAVIATGVVAYIIINHRKRQEAQLAAEKLQRENEEARGKAKEEHQRRKAEEARRKVDEERQRREAKEAEQKAEEERQRLEAEETQRKAEAERQRLEAEETQRKAEAERQRREAEEAQRKAEAEHQSREAEEAERKAEEERQRREAEEAQRKAEAERQRLEAEEASEKKKKRKRKVNDEHQPKEARPPEGRGGRPRNPPPGRTESGPRESRPYQPKPEIVCWQRERRWILSVEVPEDIWEKPELQVHQNASSLEQDEREYYWRLDQIRGKVTVRWNEDGAPQEANINLGEENYLLFKLSGQDQKQGCRVKSPSIGTYFVVVPESWERDEKFSGFPSVSPEPVALDGYLGHFFDLEKGDNKRIAFRTSEGKSILLDTKTLLFELVGTRLSDINESIGPLFGKKPPRIRAMDYQLWTDIGTIVVGQEGTGRGKWREAFSPSPVGREMNLPADTVPIRDGWYYLRIYDIHDDLFT